jgi:hypothetical protein
MRKRAFYCYVVLWVSVFSLSQCQERTFSRIESQPTQATGKVKEPDPLPPAESSVSGEYMKAFLVAHKAFTEDPSIHVNKRLIENYDIEFRQDAESYRVLFVAKRLSSESELSGGSSQLGRDVQYRINKKDYRLVGRNFFK